MPTTKKLCDLYNEGYLKKNFKDYRKLTRYPQFICTSCGRTARRRRYLCDVKRLYPKDKSAK